MSVGCGDGVSFCLALKKKSLISESGDDKKRFRGLGREFSSFGFREFIHSRNRI
jgi:hypothetical protein